MKREPTTILSNYKAIISDVIYIYIYLCATKGTGLTPVSWFFEFMALTNSGVARGPNLLNETKPLLDKFGIRKVTFCF